ncbi:hypothetical protein FLP10_02765 [Agromyces intestinalis]|uniref:Uncharacterized protein n=1 Tax=Agromyces intestinalis TaxID=2592652 RepID=A0A5C1YBJ0_9MICO|nr:hypothetical protein [Agromyces intestinalis]QEO13453.1 hypothetical protein FLP10_02765 [Agromyces intestinalis]
MSDPDGDRIAEHLHRAAEAAEPRPVDVDAVLERSRADRRRRRRVVVGGATAAVAVVAVAGLVVGLRPLTMGASTADAPLPATSAESATSSDSNGEDASTEAGGEGGLDADAPQDEVPQEDVALGTLEQATACGRPTPRAASADGLELVVTSAVLDGEGIGEVTAELSITKGSARTVTIAGAPSAVIAADGTVVWLAPGAGDQEVALAPGSPAVISLPLQAFDCGAGDAPLAPGAYDAVAVVDVLVEGRVNPLRIVSAAVPVAWAGN